MALTPSVLRKDAGIKCGAGYIAQGKKCSNGAASARKGKRARKVARIVATAALLGGAAYMRHTANKEVQRILTESAKTPEERLVQLIKSRAEASRVAASKQRQNRAGRNFGGTLSALKSTVTQRRTRASLERSFKAPARRDSVWAEGFEPRTDAGIKCGAGYIAQGKKCRNGAGDPATLAKPKGNRAAKAAGEAMMRAAHVKKAHDQFNFNRTPQQAAVHEAAANTVMAAGSIARSLGQGRSTAARRAAREAAGKAGRNLLLRALN